MLKIILATTVPALVLGIALARTTPAERAAMLDRWRPERVRLGATSSPGPVPTEAASSPPGTTTILADRSGQFEAEMIVAGRRLPILIDTGATLVSLTSQDAAAIGIYPRDSEYRTIVETANGSARVARVTIPRIRVGNVEADDVEALVARPGALRIRNLLGMSFLRRLSGFRVDGGRLVLQQ